ncbi:hypothetical protein QAD02_000003 [Eretmocerus hayati]|uniref:Uncharacterized protein n=1 Tax=Eretmocerus hayati TaxID=131215 RepID=A0ACC2NCE7_9HYME|nr:hypothetical protein QAD02_000003 [Eretmocerus hayati]
MVRREYRILPRPEDRPVPQDIRNEARIIQLETLLPVSKAKYLKRSIHSMIKACVKAFDIFDIGIFPNVNSYLSNLSGRHQPKKAYILSTEEMKTFVMTASDIEFFFMKVRHCIVNLLIVDNQAKNLLWLQINNKRFFLTFRHGSFINEAAVERTIASVPRRVAEFLGLPEPERYTSHSIRRSSATAYAETGCNEIELMRHGRWRNIKCASGYVEDTKYTKHKVSHIISTTILAPQHQTSIVQYNFQNPPPFMNQRAITPGGNAAVISSNHSTHSTLRPYVTPFTNQQPVNTTNTRAIVPARLFNSPVNTKTQPKQSQLNRALLHEQSLVQLFALPNFPNVQDMN